jgi:hypothetical protein
VCVLGGQDRVCFGRPGQQWRCDATVLPPQPCCLQEYRVQRWARRVDGVARFDSWSRIASRSQGLHSNYYSSYSALQS